MRAAITSVLLFCAALAFAVPYARAQQSQNTDWRYYGNDLLNRRYQNIDQINASNVSQLKPAWVFHTREIDGHESSEASPIEIDGTLFVSTGKDTVFALDAATGKQKWVYHASLAAPPDKLPICCGQDNRGVAYGDGMLFEAQLDDHVIALDADTGKKQWDTTIAKWQEGYSITMAPQFADGKVIVGISGGEYAIRGRVTALDAKTGKEVWKFYTTDPQTYAGDSWKNGGAPVWSNPSVDPDLGLVYITTGNASPDFDGSVREGKNLYSSSDVALDISTGKPKWNFQEVHHGLWDYDGPSPALLFTDHKDGQSKPALAHCTKGGQLFILNRTNGQPIFSVTEKRVPQNPAWQHAWPTQPYSSVEALTPTAFQGPPKGYGYNYQGYFTPPSTPPPVEQPGTEAGCEWPPYAFSPRTNYLYQGVRYEPTGFKGTNGPVKNENNAQKSTGSGFVRPLPGLHFWGYFGATDTTTGKVVWKHKLDEAPLTGPAIAGDLVFYGETSGKIHAADAKTGNILWTFDAPKNINLAGGADAPFSVYEVNGHEYVVSMFGGSAMERHLDQKSPVGDAVVAFALDGNASGVEGQSGKRNEGKTENQTKK